MLAGSVPVGQPAWLSLGPRRKACANARGDARSTRRSGYSRSSRSPCWACHGRAWRLAGCPLAASRSPLPSGSSSSTTSPGWGSSPAGSATGQAYAWAVLGVFAAATAVLAWFMRADLRGLWPRRWIWACGLAVLLAAYGCRCRHALAQSRDRRHGKAHGPGAAQRHHAQCGLPAPRPMVRRRADQLLLPRLLHGRRLGAPGRHPARGGLQHLSRHAAGAGRRGSRLGGVRPGIAARRRTQARAAGGARVGDRRGDRRQPGDRARGCHRGVPRADGVLAGHWLEGLAGHRAAPSRRGARQDDQRVPGLSRSFLATSTPM